MIISGKLHAESPIYRGNARKTLFTRDGNGSQRLVSLAGEIQGTAQSLMDAFIGISRDQRNLGLLNRLWLRLYNTDLPTNLITQVECRLRAECYAADHFFDLRMGLKLDEDRGAAEAGANYKLETVFRHSVFDLVLTVNDQLLKNGDHASKLYYLLGELQEGRFWFGAGKSKGLGRCRLEIQTPLPAPSQKPRMSSHANHLSLDLSFAADNPVLVGWNWGKVDPAMPAFAAIDGRMLIGAMRNMPEAVQQRLTMALSGPILHAEDWKKKLAIFLPKAIAAWLKDATGQHTTVWQLTRTSVNKLQKSRYPLPQKIVDLMAPVIDQPFASQEAVQQALNHALGPEDAGKAKRILTLLESSQQVQAGIDPDKWQELVTRLGLEAGMAASLDAHMDHEPSFINAIAKACQPIYPRLYAQVDQQIKLLESDVWLDAEVANREEHLRIKKLLLNGKITEQQWGNSRAVPEGVKSAAWQEFLVDHRRVQYRHMLNAVNLNKSIANDENLIAFLRAYRARTQQELSQPHHIDFRAGGANHREMSQAHGKPYDTIFMRMLQWAPAPQGDPRWEIYIPGATIKGAFRKRAAQVLRTLWGDGRKVNDLLAWMFGVQGQIGALLFSDAYPKDPALSKQVWCAMDGVRSDPKTGKPLEQAKADYLFAYGPDISFQFRMDLTDLEETMWEGLAMVGFLLQDFMAGDIPLGGQKTSGFGWVQGLVDRIQWLAPEGDLLGPKMFGACQSQPHGPWQQSLWQGPSTVQAVGLLSIMQPAQKRLTLSRNKDPVNAATPASPSQAPPKTREGFISHRSFGGYCGVLHLEGEVLTPLHVREAGEPSFSTLLQGERVNGWDFFAMTSPEASQRHAGKGYAIPSKTLRGMIRHLYAMASGSRDPSIRLGQLNPVDHLFGWVGNGPNQAIMGRLSFGFGHFHEPALAWFQIPFPYGAWQLRNGQWQHMPGEKIAPTLFAGHWRLFPHAPLAPCIKQLNAFQPDTLQADHVRAMLPGNRCRFAIRFWNLEQEELERLVWCLVLEESLAHKLGKGRQLGFGSLRLRLLPASHLIDWSARYFGQTNASWQQPVVLEKWRNPMTVQNHLQLRAFLRVHES